MRRDADRRAVALVTAVLGLWWFRPWKLFTSTTVNEDIPAIAATGLSTPGSASSNSVVRASTGHAWVSRGPTARTTQRRIRHIVAALAQLVHCRYSRAGRRRRRYRVHAHDDEYADPFPRRKDLTEYDDAGQNRQYRVDAHEDTEELGRHPAQDDQVGCVGRAELSSPAQTA